LASTVEVDAALRGCAVEIVKCDGLFEDVGVEVIFGAGGIRARDVEEVAEFGKEELVVSALGGGRLLPALAKIRTR
jgi:hypothetical protein